MGGWLHFMLPEAQPWTGTLARSHAEVGAVAVPGAADPLPESDAVILDAPHIHRRAVNSELIGVLGQDGQTLYLIEVNRTRTATEPILGDL